MCVGFKQTLTSDDVTYPLQIHYTVSVIHSLSLTYSTKLTLSVYHKHTQSGTSNSFWWYIEVFSQLNDVGHAAITSKLKHILTNQSCHNNKCLLSGQRVAFVSSHGETLLKMKCFFFCWAFCQRREMC